MDNLEKFVKENRGSFDRYEPSPVVWEKIERNSGFPGRRIFIRISAAAVLLMALGSAVMIFTSRERKDKLSALPSEIREMELFYNTTASTLYMQARPLLTSQPEMERELDSDLNRIDKICRDIKKDLRDNVSNQEVIEALIRNYTIKIRILEDMLNTLKENENDKDKSNRNEL